MKPKKKSDWKDEDTFIPERPKPPATATHYEWTRCDNQIVIVGDIGWEHDIDIPMLRTGILRFGKLIGGTRFEHV